MTVEWTITAQRRLRATLADALCREASAKGPNRARALRSRQVVKAKINELNRFLEATFPRTTIVVQNHMTGYRPKREFTTLLIEELPRVGKKNKSAAQTERQHYGAYVAKIGEAKKLKQELDAWETCRPEGLQSDLVFLPLHSGKSPQTPGNTQMCIYYRDAHQFLGVDRVVTFEEAALGATMYNHPDCRSVGLVLWELYERIAHLFYAQSFEDGPVKAPRRQPVSKSVVSGIPHLDEALNHCDKDESIVMLRRRINLAPRHGPDEFLDPVDYLNSVKAIEIAKPGKPVIPVALSGGRNSGRTPAAALMPAPRAVDVVPSFLRGCAHGDLHGRNILVANVRGKVLWPTLFDYEDMGPDNLLAWDFVKLETELKIRAYNEVFDGSEPKFIDRIQQFERDLGLATEARYLGDTSWGIVEGASTPSERLAQIVLEIRHRAAVHLGQERGRPNAWLEEYYFMLCCYGVCTMLFPNQKRRERIAALISAGAAARLAWPRAAAAMLPKP